MASQQPSSSVPASPPKVSSEDIISQKTGIGFGTGVVLSVLLFRRRAFPVWLGTGFGLGSGWTDCERSFNPVAVPGVRILPSAAAATANPSTMERLSARTAEVFDKTKDKTQELAGKGKQKAQEVESKVEEKVSSDFKIRSAVEAHETPDNDCLACRLTGTATLSALGAYSFREAYLAGAFASRAPRSASLRARGFLLVLFGATCFAGGAYRLVN
ncbi:hypothetical protein FA10DRAFT_31671 [Acaromyces ingoldii]|uniref:MICOS complex subunit MIC10 n=1 Tax=Acaromyces ingoldii TaxID=215250 RepID=A0A316YYS5_9BASI|nr:hypothetical protein FA10DRAFT_31671 [Acaromyces ingoldii]PWN93798.1 hypothetical protein FA10DRAFT_31671 [Acaromyces ingoldii]